MVSRYEQLTLLIDLIKPKSFIEIGTWNGNRAISMCETALKYHTYVSYVGFDLFDEANEETDKAELNVKPHYSVEDVSRNIESNPKIDARLIKGNTNKTLPYVAKNNPEMLKADFVFIDGGHSIETIDNDYKYLADNEIIVLDDYYEPEREGFGCNWIDRIYVLPQADPVVDGGLVKMALKVK